MVSIVLVSHSRKLAEATAELASEVAQGQCSIICAAGMDDPEHATGTDPLKVMKAIESVYSPSGVLVLMDLGSALLSTETALELLTFCEASNIKLSSAPLVEGAIAAAAAAASGLSLIEVEREARSALNPKIAQLCNEKQTGSKEGHQLKEAKCEVQWVLQNPSGLHIRSAARLVKTLTSFNSQAVLLKGQKSANAHSITSLTQLGARCGDTVRLIVNGPEASLAVTAFCQLASNSFGEHAQAHHPRVIDAQHNNPDTRT